MISGYKLSIRRALRYIPLTVTVLLTSGTVYFTNGQLVINEMMASNGSTLADEDGYFEDWIELYNAGADTISLYMHGLSDNYSRPFKWTFPDTSIAPGGFMLVWASGKNRKLPGGPLHTNYSIGADGEEILLTSPQGNRLDEIPPTEIPRDISYGRFPDGSENWFFFPAPTPMLPNNDSGYLGTLPDVVFSVDGGFYTESVSLSFTNTSHGTHIHYTLDGSEPDENSPIYSAPLIIADRSSEPNNLSTINTTIPLDFFRLPASEIFKGTVVRARILRDGYLPGRTITHSYFISGDSGSRYSLPVISIAVDSLNFFGYENGIYVPGANYNNIHYLTANYALRGIEWERPIHFELFKNNTRIYSTDAGARIHGGISRRYQQKSIRLYARSDYGDSRFNYPFFPDLEYSQYNRLVLRNSGNDINYNMFKDGFIQTLVRHLNFDTQAYQPSVVFLNGEYWGIHNIRERYDRHYLERVHQVDPHRIDLLTGNALVTEGTNSHYQAMISYIQENNIADPVHFHHVSTLMDMDNFTDYYITNIFIRNTDWPGNNIDFWRYKADSAETVTRPAHDGRWRWLMYDTDFGFGIWEPVEEAYSHNTLVFATEAGNSVLPNPDWSTYLFRTMLTNENFRNNFISRFADLLNSTFQPEHVQALIEQKQSRIEAYMPEHIHRYRVPQSMDQWQFFGDRLKRFAENRPGYQRSHIIDFFGLGGSYDLTVDVNHADMGSVRINSLNIQPNDTGIPEDPYPWSGTYFRGIPVSVQAIPATGYQFANWMETGDQSPEITITPDENLKLTAVFKPVASNGLFPEAHPLQTEPFVFTNWPTDAEPGSFPAHMAFYYMNSEHPGLDAIPTGTTSGPYNLNSGTRINGLADGGISLINDSGNIGNPGNNGYPDSGLGGVVLGINTLNTHTTQVQFTGGTLQPNSLVYSIRLQYRIGADGPLNDVLDSNGIPVEYWRNPMAGHAKTIGPVTLPESLENRPYVQLWWRYYFTGEQIDEQNDRAAQLRLDNIIVEANKLTSLDVDTGLPLDYSLHQNYPNPFNPVTKIGFDLPLPTPVRITVYNMAGQVVSEPVNGNYHAGSHQIEFNASRLASGVYIYRLETPGFTQTRKLMLLK
jgi:hypothetical protein